MSSLFPAPRPVLGALALVSALALTACASGAPDRAGAAGSGAGPSAAAPSGTVPATGAEDSSADATEDAAQPAGERAGEPAEQDGEQPGDRSTAGPAEAPAAGDPAPGAAEDGTDGGVTAGAEDGAAAGGPAAGRAAGARTGGGVPLCTTSQLEAAATPVGGAAGSVHVDLVLTNAGAGPCTLAGYAGVSFVDAAGTLTGSPAVRDATVPGTGRVLAPGESAVAGLRVGQAANHQSCDARSATGLRVYPPENTESVVIPFPVEACADAQIHQLEIQGFGA
ncbi:hypothetical protein AVL61_09005 [Kocuria rosea subsp. polaris]|uniref:DUF4232 domain-containing protein n=1 Tax=Kocuria rosea subsp. polaris TaxID=136273 RepID=A0A0W8IJN7_KOCRO|nr:DUF4232 domain-containing protein [Kocuria polaris]KUG60086.1 hypothetical protein AVL61_09005 [Kocuria polaris]